MKMIRTFLISGRQYFNLLKEWSEIGEVGVTAENNIFYNGIKMRDGSVVGVGYNEPLPEDAIGITYSVNNPWYKILGVGSVNSDVDIGDTKFEANFRRVLYIPHITIETEGKGLNELKEKMDTIIETYLHRNNARRKTK